MKFRVLPEAIGEAISDSIWYDKRHRGLGDDFLNEVQAALATIKTATHAMPKVEGYVGPHEVCRYLLKRFPYAIIVVRRPDETPIVAIAHTRRRPLYWLRRLTS